MTPEAAAAEGRRVANELCEKRLPCEAPWGSLHVHVTDKDGSEVAVFALWDAHPRKYRERRRCDHLGRLSAAHPCRRRGNPRPCSYLRPRSPTGSASPTTVLSTKGVTDGVTVRRIFCMLVTRRRRFFYQGGTLAVAGAWLVSTSRRHPSVHSVVTVVSSGFDEQAHHAIASASRPTISSAAQFGFDIRLKESKRRVLFNLNQPRYSTKRFDNFHF